MDFRQVRIYRPVIVHGNVRKMGHRLQVREVAGPDMSVPLVLDNVWRKTALCLVPRHPPRQPCFRSRVDIYRQVQPLADTLIVQQKQPVKKHHRTRRNVQPLGQNTRLIEGVTVNVQVLSRAQSVKVTRQAGQVQ